MALGLLSIQVGTKYILFESVCLLSLNMIWADHGSASVLLFACDKNSIFQRMSTKKENDLKKLNREN